MATTGDILLTTDLSEESQRSFGPVGELASDIGARIILFHVIPDPVAVSSAPMGAAPVAVDLREVREKAFQRLRSVRDKLPSDLTVDVEVATGTDVARTIAERADEGRVRFIAMATHGRSGVRRMLMGSTAEAVLRRGIAPMLLYPAA